MSAPERIQHIDGAFYSETKDRPRTRVARVVSECTCQGIGADCRVCRDGLATVWVPIARLREAHAW